MIPKRTKKTIKFLFSLTSHNLMIQHREGPHPPLPQSLPAPTIRKMVPEHQSPLRQTAQQLFPPGCESPELKSPPPPPLPSETPCKPLPPETWTISPNPPQTPPNLTTPKKKTVWNFLCNQSVLHTGEWAYTNHLLCALDTFHILLCTQSHKRLIKKAIYVCLHAHALQNIWHCSPASCLTHNVSLCTYTVFMWSIRIVCIFIFSLYRVNIYI